MSASTTDERARLSALVQDHLRQYGAEASRLLDVFAGRHRMHPTDLQALVIIMNVEQQGGYATPRLLRRSLNLTSGAVTGVVDRLVRSGHVCREPDPDDRRQTRLHYAEAGMRLAFEFFGPLGARTDAIMARLDIDQLRLVESFMREVTAATVDHRASLQMPSDQSPA